MNNFLTKADLRFRRQELAAELERAETNGHELALRSHRGEHYRTRLDEIDYLLARVNSVPVPANGRHRV